MNSLEQYDEQDIIAPVAKVFNGRYTLIMPDGEYRTYRIHTKKTTSRFAPGQRVLSLLIGSDNERDYKPFAFVSDFGISVWKKHRGGELEANARMFWDLVCGGSESQKLVDGGYELQTSKTCIVCNKALTTPTSLARGMGDICWERSQNQ